MQLTRKVNYQRKRIFQFQNKVATATYNNLKRIYFELKQHYFCFVLNRENTILTQGW